VFIRTLGRPHGARRLNDQGEFTNLQLFGVLHAGARTRGKAGLPVWLQRPVVMVGAALGRLRGQRPVVGG
jgi:hypothetical protein